MHESLGDEYTAYYFSGVCARSFVIGPVIYIGYSLFLPVSLTCHCLAFIKAKWRVVLRRGLKERVEALSINQKDIPSLRDTMKRS